MVPDPRSALLLRLVDESFDKKAWHGPNLRGGLRRVDSATAAHRPAPDRHNIWEHAVHAAYWKYTVRRRLTGEGRGSFPLKGSNWFVRPDSDGDRDTAWKADLAILDDTHRRFRAAVVSLDPATLDGVPIGCKLTNSESVYSIAMHDIYHAGQIALLKRLAGSDG